MLCTMREKRIEDCRGVVGFPTQPHFHVGLAAQLAIAKSLLHLSHPSTPTVNVMST